MGTPANLNQNLLRFGANTAGATSPARKARPPQRGFIPGQPQAWNWNMRPPPQAVEGVRGGPASDIAQFYGRKTINPTNPQGRRFHGFIPAQSQTLTPNFGSLAAFLDKGYFQKGRAIPGTNVSNHAGLYKALGQITPQAIERVVPGNVLRGATNWHAADKERKRRQGLSGLGGLGGLASFALAPGLGGFGPSIFSPLTSAASSYNPFR